MARACRRDMSGLPNAFAIRLDADFPPHRNGECLICMPIPPGELRDGEFALLSRLDAEGSGEYGLIRRPRETRLEVELISLPDRRNQADRPCRDSASRARDWKLEVINSNDLMTALSGIWGC